MGKVYGKFTNDLGCYVIEKMPSAGNYEYIYQNQELLLKVDQYGIVTAQIDPPVGEALFKREEREVGSPVGVYVSDGSQIVNCFDGLIADDVNIEFSPEKATYRFAFGDTHVTTELLVPLKGARFVMNVSIENAGKKTKKYRILKYAYPYLNELLMAPWDKNEWYTRTEYLKEENAFLTRKYSVAGKEEERRYLTLSDSGASNSHELSLERLITATRNFRQLPASIGEESEDIVYAFKQCAANLEEREIESGGHYSFSLVFSVVKKEDEIPNDIRISKTYFDGVLQEKEIENLRFFYSKLFEVRKVKTGKLDFDSFINGFLPLEMKWVSALDRGWPTGMRGVRDAANDFEGMLCYDENMCRLVLENIFSKQRSDGWYPRQIPFGEGTKFDLREFVDSACFFTEFVYDYLAYSGDFSVLKKNYPYFDSKEEESGFDHLKKGVDYLIRPESLGVHGLVKMRGGDWLDCLSGAGKKGIGESVMVSCQVVMCLGYLCDILRILGRKEEIGQYEKAAAKMTESINRSSFNGRFYNAVYTDPGHWLFSNKDEDGVKRVYIPTNAFAVISGVAKGKEQTIFDEIQNLKTVDGYRLFSYPLGGKPIEGIGKMGTGDFQPYFAENGSVYNHGSQCFLLRALAKAGKYEDVEEVLSYALPFDGKKHPASRTCSAPYAITNCYHLVPSFPGRAGFSFLTGSVAMIERAVYSWVFGLNFDLGGIVLSPCIPASFANAEIETSYRGHRLKIKFVGYGAKIDGVDLDGEALAVSKDGCPPKIPSKLVQSDVSILVRMKNS